VPDLRRFTQTLTYKIVLTLGAVVRWLSPAWRYRVANGLGDFLYRIVKLRRPLVEKNLRLAFPEKTESEINHIAHAVYRGQAHTFFEVLLFPAIRSKADAEEFFEIDPTIPNRLAQEKSGAVIVSAHFSNWELMAYAYSYIISPVCVVYKPFTNPPLDRTMNDWRALGGNEMIDMASAARIGLKRLREGKLLALVSDQAGYSNHFVTSFLGRDAAVFLGAAVLALRTRVPMILSMPVRIADGKYRLELSEIETADLSYSDENVKRLAERYTRALEAYICRYPEQWFWLHNRWKPVS
jgi:Kdo2-lipid IVA lauroyltransferase/acyltransferase